MDTDQLVKELFGDPANWVQNRSGLLFKPDVARTYGLLKAAGIEHAAQLSAQFSISPWEVIEKIYDSQRIS